MFGTEGKETDWSKKQDERNRRQSHTDQGERNFEKHNKGRSCRNDLDLFEKNWCPVWSKSTR